MRPSHDPGATAPAAPDRSDPAISEAVVLVVDDVQANVVLLERILQRVGVGRVVGITDPRQALDQYHSVRPDLILLDLHMPHLDGIAVLGALKAVIPADSFTPIVVLTADTTLEAKQQALSAGAKDFLTKPFEHTEVVLRVTNLLETRALHLSLQAHNRSLQAELRENAERERRRSAEHARSHQRVQQVLDDGDLSVFFQPILNLSTSRLVGVEALARFPAVPIRPPDQWFAEAAAVGLGAELEILAVAAAVAQLDNLPPDAYLSVNVSPKTALDPRLAAILGDRLERIVVELTEHAVVDDYDELLAALRPLRDLGVRVAVDDAGSGYSSLQHILRLRPDIIKLDITLTRGIDLDPARRALAAALVTFADEIVASITAEGIETADELATLKRIGATCGQGYHLGRPAPLPNPRVTAQPEPVSSEAPRRS